MKTRRQMRDTPSPVSAQSPERYIYRSRSQVGGKENSFTSFSPMGSQTTPNSPVLKREFILSDNEHPQPDVVQTQIIELTRLGRYRYSLSIHIVRGFPLADFSQEKIPSLFRRIRWNNVSCDLRHCSELPGQFIEQFKCVFNSQRELYLGWIWFCSG